MPSRKPAEEASQRTPKALKKTLQILLPKSTRQPANSQTEVVDRRARAPLMARASSHEVATSAVLG